MAWKLAGFVACAAIAAVAVFLGDRFPVVGAPVFAILIGVAIAAWRAPAPAFAPGVTFASKQLLQWSIVLLGAHLSLTQIARGGLASLPVMLSTFVVVLLLAYAAGQLLGVDRDLRRLLAIGTAICGGSAIAALSSVIDVDRSDVAYALGTVFAFNVVAVLTFPALGHALALSQPAFGLWAGTAINDTSSVVAAAFAYGATAGSTAVVVKLTRTLLIVPVVGFYAWKRMRSQDGKGLNVRGIFPWFVVWFLVAAAINSLGLVPASWQDAIQRIALYAIVVALAGVGLSSNVERIRSAGLRPLALGAILWVAISITSLAVAHALRLG
ncbi:MAG: putative sulfate exporter family transporter [Candidatus Eremiobacteraeota bacterium]|nr:putative sulfate exporter family transporter [Candidatus Eremiobacteraeota bacterium]